MIDMLIVGACRTITGAVVDWRCDPYGTAQRIYFANHSSHLDFIAIWSALPASVRCRVRPVAGHDYWSRGRLRPYLARDVFKAVVVERRTVGERKEDGARASIEQIALAMGRTDSIIVFPEGTRSVTSEMAPFKSGLYHLARIKPDAELIPVHLENLNRILPKGETLPVPMLSRVTFGAPLSSPRLVSKDAWLAHARAAVLHLRPAA